jgi:hypothetical protein
MPDDKRRLIVSERNPPLRVFDIFEGENVLNLYSDGSARLMIGPEASKVEFARSSGAIEKEGLQVDQREVFLRLAMPTSALIELCAIALEQYGVNVEAMKAGSASNLSTLREAIKRAAAVKV